MNRRRNIAFVLHYNDELRLLFACNAPRRPVPIHWPRDKRLAISGAFFVIIK